MVLKFLLGYFFLIQYLKNREAVFNHLERDIFPGSLAANFFEQIPVDTAWAMSINIFDQNLISFYRLQENQIQ